MLGTSWRRRAFPLFIKNNMNFITKDSWERTEFSNWFVRDVDTGKLRYDLIPINMLDRLAGLYTRGIEKYWENNWQQARWRIAIERFKQSAWRHFIKWQQWEYDEDHAIAVAWNIFAYEWHKTRLEENNMYCTEDGHGEEPSI